MARNQNKTSQLLRKPLHLIRNVLMLPTLYSSVTRLREDDIALSGELTKKHSELLKQIEEQNTALNEEREKNQILSDRMSDLVHQITTLTLPKQNSAKSSDNSNTKHETIADDHSLDYFYVKFEDIFRGEESDIKQRLEVYLPYFKNSKIESKKFPVLDIGCGRGEFVQLLQEHNIRAIGLDLNKSMIDRLKEKGIEGVEGDALAYLRKQPPKSLMAITGFHIVEHIPFPALLELFTECHRVLQPGGFVIFETPNPENVMVGACTFYMDPSHLHPLPPPFLSFMLETRGFGKTETLYLHPQKDASEVSGESALMQDIVKRLYGPQDYAAIAHK